MHAEYFDSPIGHTGRTIANRKESGGEEWLPIVYAVYEPCHSFRFSDKLLHVKTLRFNPVEIGEWLNDLLDREIVTTRMDLSHSVGTH